MIKSTKNNKYFSVIMALLAALLFGLNAPFSKLLLSDISPMFMAAFLYLGAGFGMLILYLFSAKKQSEASLSKAEMPWTIMMVLLDVLAPFLLMWGLTRTTAANASLLFNFEMVSTSVIALIFFHEAVGKRMWGAITVITFASIVLSVDFTNLSAWKFSTGSLFVLAACACWGLENNCTRNMSSKSPAQIVIIKGFGSGLTALIIALLINKSFPLKPIPVLSALILGFVAYGLSIFFYVRAQRDLGAARTSTYYAAAPFLGVLLSFLILHEVPDYSFAIATMFMLLGVYLAVREKHIHKHIHEKITHEHRHTHDDMHHLHEHDLPVNGEHSHIHTHEKQIHEHSHTPDIHHRHEH